MRGFLCASGAPHTRPGLVVSKRALHRETAAESSLDRSGRTEAASRIESLRVRVTHDVQDARRASPRDIGAMFDEHPPPSSLPKGRLDEQRIELGVPV